MSELQVLKNLQAIILRSQYPMQEFQAAQECLAFVNGLIEQVEEKQLLAKVKKQEQAVQDRDFEEMMKYGAKNVQE